MLPEIARRAISAHSDPVLDPMCGIATTLARGERQRLVCHEDVLVFQRDPKKVIK
jgi:hypothetical protein